MKNKVLVLTKIFLKNSFNNIGANKNADISQAKKTRNKIFYAILIIYLAGIFGFMSYSQINVLKMIGQEKSFLGLLFLGLGVLLIFQSMISSVNILYFSKDIEYLLPLPVKPVELVIAKLNTLFVTEYIFEFLIGLIPLGIYGFLTGAGILYYLAMILVLIVFPIVPVLISNLIIMIIMSFAKITKDRDKFQVIISMILIIGVVIFQMKMTNTNKEMTDEQMADQLTQVSSISDKVGKYAITLPIAVNSLTNSEIGIVAMNLLKLIAITIIVYIVTIYIGKKLYLRGAIGNATRGKTNNKVINSQTAYKKNSIAKSYVLKELKILVRNPVFFMQCVLPSLLMPIIFGFAIFSGVSSQDTNIQEIIKTIPNYNGVVILAGLAFIQLLSTMSYISITAISRDGLNATFTKYIPIPLYKQYIYKAVPNMILNTIEILIALGLIYFVTKMIIPLIPILIISMLFNILQSILMVMVDLNKPKLNWDSEYAVVKQNMNLIWTMIFGIVNLGITALIGILIINCNISALILTIAIAIIYIIAIYILNNYVKKNQVKLFSKIY